MSGERKSGMPAEVLIPAPTCHHHRQLYAGETRGDLGTCHTMTTMRRTSFSFIYLATASIFRASSTEGGVSSSTTVDVSLPMLLREYSALSCYAGVWNFVGVNGQLLVNCV